MNIRIARRLLIMIGYFLACFTFVSQSIAYADIGSILGNAAGNAAGGGVAGNTVGNVVNNLVGGLLGTGGGQSMFGDAVSNSQLKQGDVHLTDIPNMLVSATSWVLSFSATAAVLAIVVGALQLSLGSGAFGGGVDGRSKGKSALQYGIIGFVVAVS